MADRIDALMETIRAGLADLPDEAVNQALAHYREYIADALEAGRTEEEIRQRLGDPAELIMLVRAEVALGGAEENPGPFRLTGAARKALRGVASTTAKGSLIVAAVVPYGLAMGFYITAAAAYLGAVGAIALMAYGISGMPAVYLREKAGAAGVGILAAAFFIALGLGLWLAAKGITRVTLRVLRRNLRRDRTTNPGCVVGTPAASRIRTVFLICAAAALIGIGLVVPSGLPLRYFSIWNSMKPEHLSGQTETYHPGEIGEIEIATLNSRILLVTGEARLDTIRVTYEEPDWLQDTLEMHEGKLSFREASNGRLPFMDFIARHEGMTTVTVEVPRGYLPRAVTLESKGGHIAVDLPAGSLRARTYSGNIRFSARHGSGKVRAATRSGLIFVQGTPVAGREYASHGAGDRLAELESTDGKIEID